MKKIIYKYKKNSNKGFVGIEVAIIGALIVTFAIAVYNYLMPTFADVAVSIRDSVDGTY
jgi:hypothetical protein